MTTIYLVRHAEAEGNLYRIAQGHYNGIITPRGYQQLAALKKRFESVQIDAVYSSDLFRARTTARAIYEPKGLAVRLDEQLRMTFAVRSSVNQEKRELLEKLKGIADMFDGSYSDTGDYPAWEYKKDSKLRDLMGKLYTEKFGKTPEVVAIHAGLECGLLSDKLPGLDCVSIGPDMHDIHTSRERLEIESTRRTWEVLLEILKAL